MKSILVIGIGDFGHHLCRELVKMKNEVMIVDQDEDAMEDLEDIVSRRLVADCTSKNVLANLGVSDFDICFVCIGKDFRNNLIIVSLLKELGAKEIITQTEDEMLEKLLLHNGADEVINPNKDSAVRAAVKNSSEHIFDYLKLRAGYSIYEISPIKEWVGKSILTSNIRSNYNMYIISISKENDTTTMMPHPNSVIEASDKLMVLAHESDLEKIMKKF